MNQIKMGNRVVIIAGTASTDEKPDNRQPTFQRISDRRSVVISNGQLVGRRPGR